MILVDNNVLRSVATIDRLDLLSTHFDTVATTTGVVEERNRDAVSGYDFVDRIDRARSANASNPRRCTDASTAISDGSSPPSKAFHLLVVSNRRERQDPVLVQRAGALRHRIEWDDPSRQFASQFSMARSSDHVLVITPWESDPVDDRYRNEKRVSGFEFEDRFQ